MCEAEEKSEAKDECPLIINRSLVTAAGTNPDYRKVQLERAGFIQYHNTPGEHENEALSIVLDIPVIAGRLMWIPDTKTCDNAKMQSARS